MKRLYAIIGMAGALMAPSLYASFDGTVKMTGGTYESGQGGEFTAATTGLGTFLTFCLEDSEYFYLGGTFSYIKNTGAVKGGPGMDATDPHTSLPMDNISMGTAWLYHAFRTGGLTGSYAINSVTAAGELQQAIWWLEDETPGVYNKYVTLAETELTRNDTTIKEDSLGFDGVFVLNLYGWQYGNNGVDVSGTSFPNGSHTYLNQDQLYDPVPEPTTIIAGALLLLPFGASTLRILRRKCVRIENKAV